LTSTPNAIAIGRKQPAMARDEVKLVTHVRDGIDMPLQTRKLHEITIYEAISSCNMFPDSSCYVHPPHQGTLLRTS
jgi:hypothetical protein